jgi:TolB-like protein
MTGCSYFIVRDYNLVKASYVAADMLLKGVKDIHHLQPRRNGIYTKQPILVASFVNIDDLQQSSTFGRMIAEQIGSRIAQKGYKVIELKLRTNTVFVQMQTGELLLSRKLREISLQHDAYAVVVGTYGDSKESVYVTAKIIRTEDSVILSSYDYRLFIGPDTKQMLRKRR